MQQTNSFGTLEGIEGDKALLDWTTSVSRIVVHFYKADFKRCQIINRHLAILAKKHYNIKFPSL